ncbi:MAG TPA: DUF4244 domain-containing protein [Mycobacteriales bacterium]|jgi:hypothetical protein
MSRLRQLRARREDGMATAEYAVATVAACGFGGVLVKVLTNPSVVSLVVDAVKKAFSFAF